MSVPQTAAEAEEFIGPTIGRSGFRTAAEFRDAVADRYQALYDQGYSDTMDLVRQGLVPNDNTVIGARVDSLARTGLRDWLSNVEGIEEGPGQIIQVNRRLYDPLGSGACRIPDVYVRGANAIFDGTIAEKTNLLPQTIDFDAFSRGGPVTIIRPTGLITNGGLAPSGLQGSYGLYFH